MEPTTLLPDIEGLRVDFLTGTGDTIGVNMSALAPSARCPTCGSTSARRHSYYQRTLADLPWGHCAVQIQLQVRKFFCDDPACKRRIFTEPVPELAARYARKTKRLQAEIYLIGYSLGGRAGAKEAAGLGRDVSSDTLLRHVRQAADAENTGAESTTRVPILGVDDWAFRKGHHYGTILVDLQQHRPVDLLADREAKSLTEWLQAHPGVEVLSRDRAGAYAEGATKGAPEATQVADRFHLLKNLVEALQNVLGRHHAALRQAAQEVDAVPPATPPEPAASSSITAASTPAPTTAAASTTSAPVAPRRVTKEQAESAWRRDRRRARYAEVLQRHAQGEKLRTIAREMGLSRTTVAHYVHAPEFPERAKPAIHDEKIAPFADFLRQEWQQGTHNVTHLYQTITAQGFAGTYLQLYRYLRRVQLLVPGLPPAPTLVTFPTPSVRSAAWLVLQEKKAPTPQEAAFVDLLCQHCPEIGRAQELSQAFFTIVRERRAGDLDAWMARATHSDLPELQSFARGLQRDQAAVRAALSQPISNGQVEGQVNRLKLVKRSMYGRANFDLLRARVLPMAQAA